MSRPISVIDSTGNSISRSISARLRGLFYSILLNRWFTGAIDGISRTRSLGRRGEIEAERMLLRKGLHIVGRSYSDHQGEIDLIAVDDNVLVFVEVKTRTSDIAGQPLEAVDETKQRRISQAAISFCKQHDLSDCQCRFDVVSVVWPESTRTPQLLHITYAFEAAE